MRSSRLLALLVAVAAVSSLTACTPEPAETTPSSTPRPTETIAESASPTPNPTATDSGGDIALPPSCEDIYSAAMFASLSAEAPPLNDPGVTMFSSQNAEALEILNSGIPTMRCSWGGPSEFGLATNVSLVDAAQSAAILASLNGSGFGCAEHAGGTICRIEEKTVTLDDQEVAFGETHYVRGNGWVSTSWLNFAPEGYTEDIADTLWG